MTDSQYYLNDLWKFDPSTAEWTWMGGSNALGASGVYGNLGVPAAGNVPGSRSAAANWTDASGNFWLFGGIGTANTSNDLWMFSPATSEWTWMGGSGAGSPGDQPGVYGTLGKPGIGSIPGSRSGASTWTDANGNLWLFGGLVPGTSGFEIQFNDLWEFIPAKNEWVF